MSTVALYFKGSERLLIRGGSSLSMLEMGLEFRHQAKTHTVLNPFIFSCSLFPKLKTYSRTTAITLFHVFQNRSEVVAM